MQLARIALDEMTRQLFTGNGDIGIFDATNSSMERRAWLSSSVSAAAKALGMKYKCGPPAPAPPPSAPVCSLGGVFSMPPSRRLVFVEVICTDEKVIGMCGRGRGVGECGEGLTLCPLPFPAAANVRETKLKSPDYKHVEEAVAVRDQSPSLP